MADPLSAAGEVAADVVVQVIPPMAKAVRVAVEAVAAASMAETKAAADILSAQIDAGVVSINAPTGAGVGRVMTHASSVGAGVKSHIDARFEAMETEVVRQREIFGAPSD